MTKELIIRELCENGGMSISDIASKIQNSVPTTTKYLKELESQGWVRFGGKQTGSAGRQPSIYSICKESSYFLGVDPKHNSLMLSLMDLSGEIVAERQTALEFANTPEMMETICQHCESFILESGIDSSALNCIAFNISGRVNAETGDSHSIFNFENDDRPLARILSERMGHRVIIDNDTRMMAFGELKCAEKRNFKNFLFINVGWGIGLSIIIGGDIYYGMNGFSGEFGHTYVYDNEIMCHCGKKGCLETEVSGKAICAQLRKRIQNGEMSKLKARVEKGATLSEQDIIEAAQNDDTLSIEVIERAGTELGRQVANLINIFNPEAVIIGGAMAAAKETFIGPLQLAVNRYSLRLMSRNVAILPSVLADNAGSIGACLLARESMLNTL